MINLLKNAIKFTAQGFIKVKVDYNYDINALVVHIEDTGAGIESEDFSKLFSLFGKLARTASQNCDGIGLGLTIVKQIIDQSGGAISVESGGSGKGSLFIFTMKMDYDGKL